MSHVHDQTYGPYNSALCLILIDQGDGRFNEEWKLETNVNLNDVRRSTAFFRFAANKKITLLVTAGPNLALDFTVAQYPLSRTGPAIAAVKPDNACHNVQCGSLPCPDPMYPFLQCSPSVRCWTSERDGKEGLASEVE